MPGGLREGAQQRTKQHLSRADSQVSDASVTVGNDYLLDFPIAAGR